MKIYIATSLERAEDHQALRETLVADGHVITYDWTTHGSVQLESHTIKMETAVNEHLGVTEADLVIVLLPGGRGTHTELGIAIGSRIPTLVVGEQLRDGRECIFYEHPGVIRRSYTEVVAIAKWVNEMRDERFPT